MNKIKEFNIFTTNDLDSFDMTVVIAYKHGEMVQIHWEGEPLMWASSLREVKSSNITANNILKRIFERGLNE